MDGFTVAACRRPVGAVPLNCREVAYPGVLSTVKSRPQLNHQRARVSRRRPVTPEAAGRPSHAAEQVGRHASARSRRSFSGADSSPVDPANFNNQGRKHTALPKTVLPFWGDCQPCEGFPFGRTLIPRNPCPRGRLLVITANRETPPAPQPPRSKSAADQSSVPPSSVPPDQIRIEERVEVTDRLENEGTHSTA